MRLRVRVRKLIGQPRVRTIPPFSVGGWRRPDELGPDELGPALEGEDEFRARWDRIDLEGDSDDGRLEEVDGRTCNPLDIVEAMVPELWGFCSYRGSAAVACRLRRCSARSLVSLGVDGSEEHVPCF